MRSIFKRNKPTMGPTSNPIEEVPSQDANKDKSTTGNVEKTETSASGPSGDQESQQPRTDYAGAALDLSPMEKALVWKLDRRILGISFLLYYMNYLDRTAIGSAKLNGLEFQLGIEEQQLVIPQVEISRALLTPLCRLQGCIQILFAAYVLISSLTMEPSLS